MSQPVQFIYGLFGKDNACLYVGRTKNPKSRERYHRVSKTTNGIPFTLKLIKKVSVSNESSEEKKTIRLFKDAGQARFNSSSRLDTPMKTVYISEALHARLKIMANEQGENLSTLAEKMLNHQITDNKLNGKKP